MTGEEKHKRRSACKASLTSKDTKDKTWLWLLSPAMFRNRVN